MTLGTLQGEYSFVAPCSSSGLNRRTFDLACDIEMTQVTMTRSEANSGLHLLQFARSLEIAEVLPYEVRF